MATISREVFDYDLIKNVTGNVYLLNIIVVCAGRRASHAGQRRGGAGDGRAVQRRRAHAPLHADLRARRAVAQEVLRAQRHLPLPGTSKIDNSYVTCLRKIRTFYSRFRNDRDRSGRYTLALDFFNEARL